MAVFGGAWAVSGGSPCVPCQWATERPNFLPFVLLNQYLHVHHSQEVYMKRMLLLLIVVAATWVSVPWGDATVHGASPVNAQQVQPNEVTKFKVKGEGAVAHFSTSDDCGFSQIQVVASDDTIKEGSGKAEGTSTLFLTIFLENFCTGAFLNTVSVTDLAPEAFVMGDKLGSASVDAMVEIPDCCDPNIPPIPLNINLTWTATGPLTKGKSSFTSESPGCKTKVKAQGEGRDAVAVGTITVLGNELASQPSTSGALSTIKQGEMTIGCD
jgi:hypothetical protein